MNRPPLIVHAGTHKTGTTSLQAACAAGVRGVHYPAAGRLWNGHHNLAWQLADDPRFKPTGGTLNDLADEVGRVTGPVLVSSEDFEYRPRALAALVDVARNTGRAAYAVIVVREPCTYVESLFAELSNYHGLDVDLDEFIVRAVAERAVRYGSWLFRLDRRQLVDNFRAVFGDAVHVVDYDAADTVRLVLDVCSSVVGHDVTASPSERLNVRSGPAVRLSDAQRAAIESAFPTTGKAARAAV